MLPIAVLLRDGSERSLKGYLAIPDISLPQEKTGINNKQKRYNNIFFIV